MNLAFIRCKKPSLIKWELISDQWSFATFLYFHISLQLDVDVDLNIIFQIQIIGRNNPQEDVS